MMSFRAHLSFLSSTLPIFFFQAEAACTRGEAEPSRGAAQHSHILTSVLPYPQF